MFLQQVASPDMLEWLDFARGFFGPDETLIPMNARRSALSELLNKFPYYQVVLDSWRMFLLDSRWTAEEKAIRMYMGSKTSGFPLGQHKFSTEIGFVIVTHSPYYTRLSGDDLFFAELTLERVWRMVTGEDIELPRSSFPDKFRRLGMLRASVMQQCGQAAQDAVLPKLSYFDQRPIVWWNLLQPIPDAVRFDEARLDADLWEWHVIASQICLGTPPLRVSPRGTWQQGPNDDWWQGKGECQRSRAHKEPRVGDEIVSDPWFVDPPSRSQPQQAEIGDPMAPVSDSGARGTGSAYTQVDDDVVSDPWFADPPLRSQPRRADIGDPIAPVYDSGATVASSTYTQVVKVITPDGSTRTLQVTVPSGQRFSVDMLSIEDIKDLAEMPVGTSKMFIPKRVNTSFLDSI